MPAEKWRLGSHTTTRNDLTARSATKSRSRWQIPAAEPAIISDEAGSSSSGLSNNGPRFRGMRAFAGVSGTSIYARSRAPRSAAPAHPKKLSGDACFKQSDLPNAERRNISLHRNSNGGEGSGDPREEEGVAAIFRGSGRRSEPWETRGRIVAPVRFILHCSMHFASRFVMSERPMLHCKNCIATKHCIICLVHSLPLNSIYKGPLIRRRCGIIAASLGILLDAVPIIPASFKCAPCP